MRHGRSSGTTLHRGAPALVAAALLAACASTQRRDSQLQPIESQAPASVEADRATQEKVQQLEARVAELQKQVDALGRAAANQGAAVPPDKTAEELGQLRASVEAQGRRLDAMDRTVAQLRSPPASPERPAQGAAAAAAAGAKAGRAAEADQAPRKEAPVASEKAEYLAFARDQETRGQRSVARDMYQEYVAKFPADPTAADAHYRLGELAYADKRYREAAVEFGKVAKEFPSSPRAPDALLRTADSLSAMKLDDDAMSVLSEIPKRYPSTPAASRATERLAELSKRKSSSSASKK